LKKYIVKTRDLKPEEKWKAKFLGCNAVNLLFQCLGELPGPDWSILVLDGAQIPEADLFGKDFSGTSLRYANLDNVNFTNANFSNCDLTGVRMEETLPVQRLVVSAEETIYVLYDDGNIREWEFQAKQRAHPETILEDLQVNSTLIFQEPDSDLTIVHERYVVFYDKGDDRFQKVAAFRVQSNLLVVHANETRLLVLGEGKDRNVMQLVDLQKQRVINQMSVLPLSIVMYFTDDAFAVFDEDNGLRIVRRGAGHEQSLILSDARKVSCLAAVCVSQRDNRYRLAVGQKDGLVHHYTIDLGVWGTAGHDSYKAHDKAVKDVVFLDSCRIASGGFDRKIQLLSIHQDECLKWERELKMKMQCRGMKIEGVEREKVERLKLQEFINNDKSDY
jgi:WD40 repeat protein